MSINLNQILQHLDNANVAAHKRAAVISVAVARAVGYSLQLPTSPVENPKTFYIGQCQAITEEIVSQINEAIAIDVEKTCDLICSVWMFRYRLVFNANNGAVRDFLDDLVRAGSTEFPGYVAELLNELPDAAMLDYIVKQVQENCQGA